MNNPADTLAALADKLVTDWQQDGKMPPMAWHFREFAIDAMNRALASLKGEAVWQFQQQGYPYPWLDAKDEADARHWERAGYPIRVLYTTPPAPQAVGEAQYAEYALTDRVDHGNGIRTDVFELRPNAAITPSPAPQGGGEVDYADIANRAQAVTGRSIWPSTAKAILDIATPPAQQPGEVGLAWRTREHVGRVELFAPTEPLEHSVGPSGFTVDRPVYDDTFHCVFWHGNRGHMVGKYKSEEAAKAAAGEHLSRLVRALAALATKEKGNAD